MISLLDLTKTELTELVVTMNQPEFRAVQLLRWLSSGASFSEMTNLPEPFRKELEESYVTGLMKCAETLVSKDGTRKYLFELEGGNFIESVLMKYKYGYSACISSQLGCKMGCNFCASTGVGFMRNLSSGEMLGQIISMSRYESVRIKNIDIMGIGEPLDNYENLVRFLRQIHSKDFLGMSYRNISISTCGLVPEMLKLAEEGFPVTLSVSLHSPFDVERSEMMPINKKYGISEVIKACKLYTQKTGRRITFEYTMINGVNDSRMHSEALSKLLKGMLCHVNLIPLNEIPEGKGRKSQKDTVKRFAEVLKARGVEATVRRELGKDIYAACGQLRRIREGYMDFYAITDVGNKRMNNEDYYGYLMGKQGNPHYFIVADGMGGHNSGEVASKLAVEYILKNVKEHNYPFADEYEAKTFIKDMLEQANSLIYRNSVAERVNEGMGTTAVMAVINGKKLIVGNVGDSRAYIVRKNGIKQLTNDHSYIEELIRAGEITREQSENHPDRHIITRALGGESHIAVDIFSQDMERGDLLILCSDGLSSVSSVDEIYNTVKVFTSCKDLAFALVEMAKNNGSSDNITIMAVRI